MTSRQTEKLLRHVTKQVYMMYPSVEWEDLEAQAWLILSERIGDYDKSKGKLSTYLYSTIKGHLQNYIQREVLKEQNMNGLRVHTDLPELTSPSPAPQIHARMEIEELKERLSGTSLRVVEEMLKGKTQKEVAEDLQISKQRVGEVLKMIREGQDG